MKRSRFVAIGILALLFSILSLRLSASAQSLKERNEVLFEQLQRVHALTDRQIDSIRAIFRESGYVGQGNPAITKHPLTPEG
jgi:hypothetical protein